MAIEQNEVCPSHFWDAVDWETNRLVNCYHQIEKNNRKRAGPNQGGSQEDEQRRIANEKGKAFQEILLEDIGFSTEVHFPFVHFIMELLLLSLKFAEEIYFCLPECDEDCLELVDHAGIIAGGWSKAKRCKESDGEERVKLH